MMIYAALAVVVLVLQLTSYVSELFQLIENFFFSPFSND